MNRSPVSRLWTRPRKAHVCQHSAKRHSFVHFALAVAIRLDKGVKTRHSHVLARHFNIRLHEPEFTNGRMQCEGLSQGVSWGSDAKQEPRALISAVKVVNVSSKGEHCVSSSYLTILKHFLS